MSNGENIDGDEEFQDYLDKDNTPIEDQLSLIVDAISRKAETLVDLYSKSLEYYKGMRDDDPLKNELKIFISDLIKNGIHTLNQFDYAIISNSPDDDDDDEEDNGDENGI